MIKPILYMAISANGFINNSDGKTPWCESEWKRYSVALQKAGCLIVGRRTHEIMEQHGEYQRLGVRRVVVLTRSGLEGDKHISAATTPDEALTVLGSEGFEEVIVGGGAQVNAAFLNEQKIREIYLDVEPFLFGTGLPLLSPTQGLDLQLRLDKVERYAPNAIGLEYSVL